MAVVSPGPQTPAHLAIPQLLEEYGGRIYALGLRLCGRPQDAEDLVQETFSRALRSWARFEGRSSPGTWLYTIAVRTCRKLHRSRRGRSARMASLDELMPFDQRRIAVPVSDLEGPLDAQIRAESRSRVEAAIVALPPAYRLPLVLKEIVGLPIAQVAQVLGLAEGTVKIRVHRGRLKLRAELDKVLPRTQHVAPPPAYPVQVCLDLLTAKQEALDRGVPFEQELVCERCRSVFDSLDLAQETCRQLAVGGLPREIRTRILSKMAVPAAERRSKKPGR